MTKVEISITQDEAVKDVCDILDRADAAWDDDAEWTRLDELAIESISGYAKYFGVTYAEFEDWCIERRMFGEGMSDFEG